MVFAILLAVVAFNSEVAFMIHVAPPEAKDTTRAMSDEMFGPQSGPNCADSGVNGDSGLWLRNTRFNDSRRPLSTDFRERAWEINFVLTVRDRH
jgi:hypothetical protein